MTSTAFRPSDQDLLRSAVRQVASASGIPVVFAGLVANTNLMITELAGTRTKSLHRLLVRPGEGVGGSALHRGRPTAVDDYIRSAQITHQHDSAVLAEGLRSMVALPILVDEVPRGVLYAAMRDEGTIGPRTAERLVATCASIATELAIRDEVDRRVGMLEFARDLHGGRSERQLLQTIREAHAELLAISRTTPDRALADRIDAVLSNLQGPGPGPAAPSTLSRREIDVLVQVALGCSYEEVGRRLSLRRVTVKSYMQSVLAKLDTHSRNEAVVVARRRGLLP